MITLKLDREYFRMLIGGCDMVLLKESDFLWGRVELIGQGIFNSRQEDKFALLSDVSLTISDLQWDRKWRQFKQEHYSLELEQSCLRLLLRLFCHSASICLTIEWAWLRLAPL